MKKSVSWIAFLVGFMVLFVCVQLTQSAPPGPSDPAKPEISATGESVGYLEDVIFEKLKGKERITLVVTKQSGVNIESTAGNTVQVKMTNVFVPEELRKSLGEGRLANVIRVLPVQQAGEGIPVAILAIDLREKVPYSVSQRGLNVLIDFNVASLEAKLPAETAKTPETAKEAVRKEPAKEPAREPGLPTYTGRKISLDFQDANIKAVLRLLAEEGGITIVSGDDVKGNVTVHMKKVPWDQALDTILSIMGLAKKQMGDVISVMSLERMKKDEADRKAGEEDRLKAELIAKKAEQERLEERGKLRQVAIEAKIVEATDEFVRNLGVRWGGVQYGMLGDYNFGLMAGTNPDRTRAQAWSYPANIPFTDATGKALTAFAVNYPAAVSAPTLGLVIGGSRAVLEAQLQALETTSDGKIISSPKITTMDNVKATIKQGEEIPYITIDKDGNRSISFKEAVLKLDVKPKITPDGTISMEIKATNDFADYSKAAQLGGNPPINKSEVESKIVVQDGDTIVIGGILKTQDYKDVSGIPWLSKIPVLGWLFKYEAVTKKRRQLLIFITPKVMQEGAVAEQPGQIKG
ncbi:MAG: hypothetical protein FJ139_01615 [Deltaproteobacteria bacterium]|nr:hypothetical protein [Deltaproteobacteria bacterium]